MSSTESNARSFLIGGRYRNRRGEYEVMDVVGNQLHVVYNDGAEDVLDAIVQERIMRNIALETTAVAPYRNAGALDRNRRYFRSLGFLASRVTMMEAIVHPKAQAGFVDTYRTIVGRPPQVGAIGYYVHQQEVDKWGNELRITFDASATELQVLDFGPGVAAVENPSGAETSWRINRNSFWWDLLRVGFRMGNHQILDEIRDSIPQEYRGEFDDGTKAAL